MAFSYGFYNSHNGDRRYSNEQISALFDGLITDGVFDMIGEFFATIPGDGIQVVVKTGKAWFNHTWAVNDAYYPINLPKPDVTRSRIDAIVLEINATADVRASSIKVVSGGYSSNPVKPALTNFGLVRQYALSYVTIRPNAYSIGNADIEINVGKSSCPFVTGILKSVDIDDLFNQWAANFQKFMTTSQTNYNNFMTRSGNTFSSFMTTSANTFDSLVENSQDRIDSMVNSQTTTFNQFMTGSRNSFNSMLTEQRSTFENWMDTNEDDFQAWWANIKAVLNENTVGRLQNQIDDNKAAIAANDRDIAKNASDILTLRSDLTAEINTRASSDAALTASTNAKQPTIGEVGMLMGLGGGQVLGVPLPAITDDFLLFVSGQHPILCGNLYNDRAYYKYMQFHDNLKRTISLSGNAQQIDVYDGG